MSGELSQKIKNEIVKPEVNYPLSTVGYIEEYYKKTNRVKIKIDNPYDQNYIIFDNIDLPNPMQGMSFSGPFRGDKVFVTFPNNNFSNPRIIQFIEGNYFQNIRETKQKHETQGSYLPDIEDEIYDDYENPDEDKIQDVSGFFGLITDFVDKIISNVFNKKQNIIDPEKVLEEDFECIPFFDTEETGLTHPKTKSTIKLKNDGSIDIFSYMNEGIRINPITKTITTICQKFRVLIGTIFLVYSQQYIKIKAKKYVNVRTEEENITIMADEKNILLRAEKGEVEIKAQKLSFNGLNVQDIVNQLKQEILGIKSEIKTSNTNITNQMNTITKDIETRSNEIDSKMEQIKQEVNTTIENKINEIQTTGDVNEDS